MTSQFISDEGLRQWVTDLMKRMMVIGPVRVPGSDTRARFAELHDAADLTWQGVRTELSAKDFFLPATETLVTWRQDGDSVRADAPRLDAPRVLFGARPCDGHALSVLDRLMLREPVDTYYAARRASTAIVAFACTDGPFDGCFCTSVGGGPRDAGHVDILLTRVPTGYLVHVETQKGSELLPALTAVDGITAQDVDAGPAYLDLPPEEVWRRAFGDRVWQELGERCLGCKSCAYVCPVCHCFDVRDRRASDGSVERIRCWDSCQGAQCYVLAGGHNARPTQKDRQRQRYMHKFLYYPAREGAVSCVGCGRCVAACPAGIDVREVIADVAALEVVR